MYVDSIVDCDIGRLRRDQCVEAFVVVRSREHGFGRLNVGEMVLMIHKWRKGRGTGALVE